MDVAQAIDAGPVHNDDVEKWLLGCILLKPSVIDELEFLKEEHFFNLCYRAIFADLMKTDRVGSPIDIGILKTHFTGDDWMATIAEIVNSVPTAYHFQTYANDIIRMYKQRVIREACVSAMVKATDPKTDPDDVVRLLESGLAVVDVAAGNALPTDMGSAALDAAARVDHIMESQTYGIPSGLSSFDMDHGGFFAGELNVLAARPGCGKTSLAMQIAYYNALRGRCVYFASLEMDAVELATRVACGDSGVSSRLVRSGKLSREQISALNASLAKQPKTLHVHDLNRMTVSTIRRSLRRLVKDGLTLAVVDYLQLLTPEDIRVPREQQVSGMIRALKGLAREFKIPILVLCQLNRQSANDNGIPQLHHLRESGSIEQDSDLVMLLYKNEKFGKTSAVAGDNRLSTHNTILFVAKNRNGETGPTPLHWQANRTMFFSDPPENLHERF